MTEHPIHRLDDDVHQRVRLGILASLTGVTQADFAHLKSTLELTDGNLGRHLQVLEESGLVKVTKTFENRRPRTWVNITRKGSTALRVELDALRELMATVDAQLDGTVGTPTRTLRSGVGGTVERSRDI